MNITAMLRAFCDAVEQHDGKALAALFTEDGVYHDVFYGAFIGREKIAALIEEGRNHLLLGSAIEVGCPVRILQGAQDPDVPWQHAFALAHRLPAEDVVLTMIQDGDHRLSRPQDIARIIAAVAEMK